PPPDGRRVLRPPRRRRGGGGPAGVRAAPVVRRRGGDPHVQSPGIRSGDPLPDPRPGRRSFACGAGTGGRAFRRSCTTRGPAEAGRGTGLLSTRLRARRLPRWRLGERTALAAPRDPDGEPC